MSRVLFGILLIILASSAAMGQKKGHDKIDSLVRLLNSTTTQSAQAKLYAEIAKDYLTVNADSGIRYAMLANSAFTKVGNDSQLAINYNTLGMAFKYKGIYAEAMKQYVVAMRMAMRLGDETLVARVHNNMGNIYNAKADYDNALKHYFASLEIRTRQNEHNGMAAAIGNIGLVYKYRGDNKTALKYFDSARRILGTSGDPIYLSTNIANIGSIKELEGDLEGAYADFMQALQLRLKADEKNTIASSYNAIGHNFFLRKNYALAERYCLMSIHLSREIGSLKTIKEAAENLSNIYAQTGQYKKSREYYIDYIAARDSMFNSESERKLMEQQLQFDYERKEAQVRAEQSKKDLVAAEQIKRDKNTRRALLAGIVLLLGILSIAVYAFRLKRRENRIIRQLADRQEEIIASRTQQLAESNRELAATNRKLLELIQYNAHNVREPLSRIMGIMSVVDVVTADELENEVWPGMVKAVNDLDNNIQNIIHKAEDTNSL